jgi:hypothetical protein
MTSVPIIKITLGLAWAASVLSLLTQLALTSA